VTAVVGLVANIDLTVADEGAFFGVAFEDSFKAAVFAFTAALAKADHKVGVERRVRVIGGFVDKAITVVVESVADLLLFAGLDVGLANFLTVGARAASDGAHAFERGVARIAHAFDIDVDQAVAVVVEAVTDLFGAGVDRGIVVVAVASEARGTGAVAVAVAVDAKIVGRADLREAFFTLHEDTG